MSRWRRRGGGAPVPSVEVSAAVTGAPVRFPLGKGHLLIAGATGSGKSTVLRYLLANAATDPTVVLVGVDLKLVELSPWRPRLTALVVDRPDVAPLLGLVLAELSARRRILERAGLVSWSAELGPWVLVVVDELAEVVEAGSPAERDMAAAALAALVSIGRLGRALGIHLVAATQRPAADVLTGALRGQSDYRLGLRMRDPAESRMMASAATADLTTLGAGGWSFWLPPLPDRPELCRAPLIPVGEVPGIARRTAGLRPELWRLDGLAGIGPTVGVR